MDRPERGVVPRGAIARHPALLAWREVSGAARQPTSIEILKPEKRKSAVYRLNGAGPSGTAVIAKRQREGYLEMEKRLYLEVFPGLSVSTLAVYGFVEAHDGYSWLFLEDAGEEWYSPRVGEHVALAADWLAALHTTSSPTAWLPRTGSAFQLDVLSKAQTEIRACLGHRALTLGNAQTLELILCWLHGAEEHWPEIEDVCAGVPESLVHGDFVPKNVRVRRAKDRAELVAFDWETSGWATPAVDLGLLPPGEDALRSYQARIREAGWELAGADLLRLRTVGDLFRLVHCVHWESRSFAYDWIGRAMSHMEVYEVRLRAIVEGPSLPVGAR